jgi:hypothetical protein
MESATNANDDIAFRRLHHEARRRSWEIFPALSE